MNSDTTQTPRTDAEESNAYIYVSGLDAEDVQKAYDFSRQLERELNASKAEVERLNQHIKTQNLIAREEAKTLQRWKEWGMTHEEKGKQLEANLRRAIEIADVLRSGGSRACRELHHTKRDQHEYTEVCPVEERLEKASEELDGFKAALNHTDK
jgi:hypothetical protein